MHVNVPHSYVALVREIADAAVYPDAEGRTRFQDQGGKGAFRAREPEALHQSSNINVPGDLRQRHRDGSRLPAGFTTLIDRAFKGRSRRSALMRSVGPRWRKKAAPRDQHGWGRLYVGALPCLSEGARPTASCGAEFIQLVTYAKARTMVVRPRRTSCGRARNFFVCRRTGGRAGKFQETGSADA